MGIEARQVLSLLGDGRVTMLAFGAIILFAVHLVKNSQSPAERLWSIAILAVATLWMLIADAGMLRETVASWSPLAVLLLALGNEARRERSPAMKPASSSNDCREPTDNSKALPESGLRDGSRTVSPPLPNT
jgi:hypothetical protein